MVSYAVYARHVFLALDNLCEQTDAFSLSLSLRLCLQKFRLILLTYIILTGLDKIVISNRYDTRSINLHKKLVPETFTDHHRCTRPKPFDWSLWSAV